MELMDVEPFVPWLIGATTPEVAVIMAVTGYDGITLDGLTFPTDGHEMSKVIALVETHRLHNVLCRVAALDRNWWRVVANWDRLVSTLDAAEPKWRDGAATDPATLDDALNRLYDRPVGPRRVLLDMDGPLADFDQQCWTWATSANARFDIDDLSQQAHRYITEHLPDPNHRESLRAVIDAPGWYRSLPVTPGAQEGVEALLAAGHEVIVCSKPHDDAPSCVAEKLAWLGEHFPMLTEEYVFTRDKAYAHGGHGHDRLRGILLDDAIVHGQVVRASWEPVAFACPFNGPGSIYGRYPRWQWGDNIERLAW